MLLIEKLPTRYFAGTASVQAGSTIVTPHDAAWAGYVWGDDLFFLPSQPLVPPVRIEAVNEDGDLVLAYPWPGVNAVEAEYEVRYVGIIERSTAQSRRVLEQLGDVKSWADVFVATDADRLALESPSNPLRAGFRVLVAEDGLIWAKASGAYGDWLPPAEFQGPQGNPGPYTSITFGPVTTVSPTTPASAVVVTTGPASIRIDLSIPKGLDGTGTGDFVGPNGGVADGDLVAFSGATGKAGKKAGAVTNAQLSNIGQAIIKGRASGAGVGSPQDLTANQVLTILAAVGNYARSNILGPVSQSSGIPTGAIIERGSNANGEYIRFADGTQICLRNWTESVAITTAYNAFYYGVISWTFPAAFATGSTPSTPVGALTSGRVVWTADATDVDPAVAHRTIIMTPATSGFTADHSIRGLAVGRWF